MISRQEARGALEQYASTWVFRQRLQGEGTGPLIFLGDEDSPFAHVGVLKDPEDGKSAYHIAHALHPTIEAMDATCVTVCMLAYKVIQGVKYHGFILYHVDDEGYTHTRILDPTRGHHWILDGSPYWRAFPYTFGEGPHDMPAILGHHEEPTVKGGFDELLRP